VLSEHTHANAIIKLVDNAQNLVARGIVFNVEGRVVRADFRDVAILPAAELRIVVAWNRIRRKWSSACLR